MKTQSHVWRKRLPARFICLGFFNTEGASCAAGVMNSASQNTLCSGVCVRCSQGVDSEFVLGLTDCSGLGQKKGHKANPDLCNV